MKNSSDEVQVFATDDPLAGMIRCRNCHGAVVRVNKRYYGCARRYCCENKLLMSKSDVEEVLVKDLREKFLGGDVEEDRAIYVAHTSIQTLALVREYKKKWRKR